jgi:hypothetical protein
VIRFLRRLRIRLTPDRAAEAIKAQIRLNQRRHMPIRHLQQALKDLRHAQLTEGTRS